MTELTPMLFEPILMPKVWGGRRLESYCKRLPPGRLVGESWELADLASTDPSGGGGDAARSLITHGNCKGMTITEAVAQLGDDLMGGVPLSPIGGFPLLVKYLDARENLSVQVHPSPAYAAAHAGAHLKTESWVILKAERGDQGEPPVIYKGIKDGVTSDQFRGHIEDGTAADDLVAVEAVVGDCHTLPSGTCHALGAGVLVAEVQTPSDTTFRVYDWTSEYERPVRELHVEQALECISFGPAPEAMHRPAHEPVATIARTEFYSIDEAEVIIGKRCELAIDHRPLVLMCIDGAGIIVSRGGHFEPVPVAMGSTALIPAAIAPDCDLQAASPLRVLRVTVGG